MYESAQGRGFRVSIYKPVGVSFGLPHHPSPFLYCTPHIITMSSSSSNVASTPLIVFGDQSKGSQVPVVPNQELEQGAFCIVNPDFWGSGNHRVFNGTMNYTEVCVLFHQYHPNLNCPNLSCPFCSGCISRSGRSLLSGCCSCQLSSSFIA